MRKAIILSIVMAVQFIAHSQSKRIINDYQEMVNSLVSIKSEVEDYAKEVKLTWATDSFLVDCRVKYTNLKATMDGLIASFQTIIRKPSLISDDIQARIDVSLQEIKAKAEAFKVSYVKGASAKAGNASFSASGNPIVLLQSGTNLFVQIKNLITSEREKRAQEFKTSCTLKPWMEF